MNRSFDQKLMEEYFANRSKVMINLKIKWMGTFVKQIHNATQTFVKIVFVKKMQQSSLIVNLIEIVLQADIVTIQQEFVEM